LDIWLAEIGRLRGDSERSEGFLADALEIVVPAGHRIFEVEARVGLSLLHAVQRRSAPAREHAARAHALLAADEDWRGLAGRVELTKAAVGAAEGDLPAAEAGFARAIEIFRQFSLPWDEADALLLWGRSLGQAGEPTRAIERFDNALSVYDRCGAGPTWRDRVQRERSSIG
jgi:tetratricopeptide (TPR) repeat protein